MIEQIDLGIPGLTNVERIGAGGYAVVYRARQTDLDRTVVVKVLQAVDAEASRRRFDRERRAMGRLSQAPGIAPLYDSGFTPAGQPYLLMPFYEQGSLQDRLEHDGPLEPEEVQRIGMRIARAVDVAHAHGVLHRDLKPANILMTRSGEPDVADFGIAHLVDDAGATSQALTMTPLYTAPEVFDGVDVGAASDIYSIGALLYALLAGRPAYSDPDGRAPVLSLMRRINEDPLPPFPESTPPALASVIASAMSRNQVERPATAGVLADRLEAADLSARPARRGRRRLLGAVAAILALAAAGAVAGAILLDRESGGDGPEIVAEPSVAPATPAPTETETPATVEPAFDIELAAEAGARSIVRVESFSCVGANSAIGVLLNDGLVITDASILSSPWWIEVTRGGESLGATPLTSDLNRSLGMVLLSDPEGFDRSPLARVVAGQRVAVVGADGFQREATVADEGGTLTAVLSDDADAQRGDVVMTEQGALAGLLFGSGPAIVTIDSIQQDWNRTAPRQDCSNRARDLVGGDDAASPAVAELLVMQGLSDAYADEEWDEVRRVEPATQPLSDDQFAEAWRPLRQGFVYPVERVVGSGGASRWRLGLVGHETWQGGDLTTLSCLTWLVDVENGEITQVDDERLVVFGSQPGDPQRGGFVDPGDLRNLILERCSPTSI